MFVHLQFLHTLCSFECETARVKVAWEGGSHVCVFRTDERRQNACSEMIHCERLIVLKRCKRLVISDCHNLERFQESAHVCIIFVIASIF